MKLSKALYRIAKLTPFEQLAAKYEIPLELLTELSKLGFDIDPDFTLNGFYISKDNKFHYLAPTYLYRYFPELEKEIGNKSAKELSQKLNQNYLKIEQQFEDIIQELNNMGFHEIGNRYQLYQREDYNRAEIIYHGERDLVDLLIFLTRDNLHYILSMGAEGEKKYQTARQFSIQSGSPAYHSIDDLGKRVIEAINFSLEDNILILERNKRKDRIERCSPEQLQHGPFYHFTSDLETTLKFLSGELKGLRYHSELRLPTLSVSCSRTFLFSGKYRLTLKPTTPLNIYPLSLEEYKMFTKPLKFQDQEKAINLIDKITTLSMTDYLDGLSIPLGGFKSEEYEIALFEHSLKKFQVVDIQSHFLRGVSWNLDPDQIKGYKKEYPDIIKVPVVESDKIKRGIYSAQLLFSGFISLSLESPNTRRRIIMQNYNQMLKRFRNLFQSIENQIVNFKVLDITEYDHPDGPFIHWELELK